jgi:hypothetical protein
MKLLLVLAALSAGTGRLPPNASVTPSGRIDSPAALAAFVARARTPSFARQMKLGCNVCHMGGFPQLTRFGRLFKLNGYTLSGLPQITGQLDSASRRALELSPIPGLSLMAIVSATRTGQRLPGVSAVQSEYPQQLSLFYGGEITPKVGALAQVTYSDATGTLAIDNTDVRFATHTQWGHKDVLYGVTLHNNPSVQDVWNTAPAWRYPFAAPALAPQPGAATLVDGQLAQSVLGLGTYALFDNIVYAEVSGYTSAPQGPRSPNETPRESTINGAAPYWRLALQNRTGPFYAMVGTFGMSAKLYPRDVGGLTNEYTDVGGDAQFEQPIGGGGGGGGSAGALIGRVSYVHEDQTLNALYAQTPRAARNVLNTLSTFRANATYSAEHGGTFTIGYFDTSGSRDDLLYAPAAITGSRTGSPNTRGEILEVAVNPWLNTRLGVQYTLYQRFNGSGTAYDIASGRSARDNNALYVYLWLAF